VRTVGLTGGIGSGKSAVSALLAARGAVVLDAGGTPVGVSARLELTAEPAGLLVEAAAAVLEVPVGTVKSRCSRGRARLLPLLAPLREQGAGNHPGPGAVPPVDEPSRVAPLAPSPSTRKEASP